MKQKHILVVFLTGFLCSAPSLAQRDAAPVVVAPAAADQITTRLQASGQSRALRSVTLHPDAAGVVQQINIQSDQYVTAGTTLLQLDDAAEQVNQSLAQVRLDDANRLLDRYERTLGTGTFTETTIDAARRDADLARLEAEQTAIALADRQLLAPFDGHLGLTTIEPGMRVDEQTAITTLDDRSALIVRFSLPEQHFGDLTINDPVTLTARPYPQQPMQGVIQAIASRIDESTGTFSLEARVANPNDRLRPGMRFIASLTLPGPAALSIAETALQWGDDGAYVWVIREAAAARVNVDLLGREPGRVMISGDLEPGEDVVIEGTQRMRPGLSVRIIAAEQLNDDPALDATRTQAGQ